MAQRLPAFLKAVCTTDVGYVGARLGTAQHSLDVLNLRGFHLGRRCRVSPAPPGCFVLPKEKQATMAGRSWRHFVVHWPHTVAGLAGPSSAEHLYSSLRRSGRTEAQARAATGTDDATEDDVRDEIYHSAPCAFEVGEGSEYHALFRDMAVEDAVQDMYCQAATLSGRFFGDNAADKHYLTGTELDSMVAAAFKLGRCIQILLGPVHTSKLHRLMFHLGEKLNNRGNLSEGDTSVNESLHKVCKRMYSRSKKRGPKISLQMMRGEQSQTKIMRSMKDEGSDEGCDGCNDGDAFDDEERAERLHAARDGHPTDAADIPRAVLRMSTRGVRVAVGDVPGLPGMKGLADLLEVDPATTTTVAKTLVFAPKLEWDASRDAQYFLRATPSFNGRPWYDHLRYLNDCGAVCWGLPRLVLRRIADTTRHCVVVWRMRRVEARRGCVLTAHGCRRLAWDVLDSDTTWPAIDIVDVDKVLRLEHVLPDWQDLADRAGIDAMLPSEHTTSQERRQQRFFVNAFYPWTSRAQS